MKRPSAVSSPEGTEASFVNSLPGPLELLTGHLPFLELALAYLSPPPQATHGRAPPAVPEIEP